MRTDATPPRIAGLTEDEQVTLCLLWSQLDANVGRNLLRQGFYDAEKIGRRVETIAPSYYQLGITLGWCGKAVDLLARRCTLDGFTWAGGSLRDLGMDELFRDNHLRAEIRSAATSSLIHGPSFLVNTRGEDGDPVSVISAKDALNATGSWNVRRRGLDNLLSIIARDGDGNPTEFALYLDDLTIKATKSEGTWSIDRQSHDLGMPAEAMVYKPRVGREFGYSRISRAMIGFHTAGVRTLMRLEGHADVYSYPQMMLLGADTSVFSRNGVPASAWQVALGRVFGIPDDDEQQNPRADVKYFQAASPEPHLATLNAVAKLFAREASLPDTSFAMTDLANPTSADAIDAGRDDLIGEAEGATDDWSQAVQRSAIRGLAIQNGMSWADANRQFAGVQAKFRNPRFLSRAAAADAGTKQLAAVPWLAETEVGLELLGLSEDQIQRAVVERRRAQARANIAALTRPAAPQAAADAVTG